jgi:hypothetical protein
VSPGDVDILRHALPAKTQPLLALVGITALIDKTGTIWVLDLVRAPGSMSFAANCWPFRAANMTTRSTP